MATKTNPRRKFNTLTMTVEATATKCGVVVVAAASLPPADAAIAIIDVAGVGSGQQA